MNEQRLNELTRLFNEKSPIAQYFGMKLSFGAKNEPVIDLPYKSNLNHSMGSIHGGVYATMLDIAGWFAAAAQHEVSRWVATSEMSVHFLEPATGTPLRACGSVIKHGKRQDVTQMSLYADHDRLVGCATGTYIVLPKISVDRPVCPRPRTDIPG